MASILGSKSKSKLSSGSSKGGKSIGKKFSNPILILIVVLGVILMGLVFSFFKSISATETYYVLGVDVPAHSQISVSDLKEVKTRKGTAPASIGKDQVQQGQVYAQYDLLAGDVLTNSNTGGRSSLYNGVSDQWAVTSFTIDSTDAVDGNIMRGDYFDILGMGSKASQNGEQVSDAIQMGQGGTYVYYNVMCLFTTSQKTSETAKDGTTVNTGESLEYFVAMPPKDIAMLHAALNSLQIKLVLTPRENNYKKPNAQAYAFSTFTYNGEQITPRNASLCDDSQDVSSDCTDNTFLDVRRNKFGVPYNATDSEATDLSSGKTLLTASEEKWCDELFSDPYYLGSRWDADKTYCRETAEKSTNENQRKKADKNSTDPDSWAKTSANAQEQLDNATHATPGNSDSTSEESDSTSTSK